MPAIKDWLKDAASKLSSIGIPSAILDAEIILSSTLNKNRTYLHAHNDDTIEATTAKVANDKLNLRLNRMPIAYIIGHKEFYGRDFIVTSDTLIPRPESESIIDLLKDIFKEINKNQTIKIIDVGTGSGCLGITAKLELQNVDVTLIDISNKALEIAGKNAKKLSADVKIIQNDLLKNLSIKSDIIIANLPYVDQSWNRSPETDFEPSLALFADNNGLSIIEKLILQTNNALLMGGYLIIEADPDQHRSLIEFAKKQTLKMVKISGYAIEFKKVDSLD